MVKWLEEEISKLDKTNMSSWLACQVELVNYGEKNAIR